MIANFPNSATKVHKKNDIHNSVCHFFAFFLRYWFICYGIIVISTRRFSCRPSSVSFVATGLVSP